jgi:phosphoribosylformylglycinamidine synthase subunit PurS
MKARVLVMMKSSVLDPQGQTVKRALNGLGHAAIAEVRQGKCFEVDFAPGTSKEMAAKELEAIASEILSNPVIEDYRVEFP